MPRRAARPRPPTLFKETIDETVKQGLVMVHRLRKKEDLPRAERVAINDFLCKTFGICHEEIYPLLHSRDHQIIAYLERRLREKLAEGDEELEGRKAS